MYNIHKARARNQYSLKTLLLNLLPPLPSKPPLLTFELLPRLVLRSPLVLPEERLIVVVVGITTGFVVRVARLAESRDDSDGFDEITVILAVINEDSGIITSASVLVEPIPVILTADDKTNKLK